MEPEFLRNMLMGAAIGSAVVFSMNFSKKRLDLKKKANQKKVLGEGRHDRA